MQVARKQKNYQGNTRKIWPVSTLELYSRFWVRERWLCAVRVYGEFGPLQNVWNGRLRGLLPVRSGNGSPSRRLRQHLPDRRYAVQRRTSIRQFAVDGNTLMKRLLLLLGTNALFTRDTLILNVFCFSIVNCSVVFTGYVAWFWKRHFGPTDGRMRQRLKQTSIPFPPPWLMIRWSMRFCTRWVFPRVCSRFTATMTVSRSRPDFKSITSLSTTKLSAC